MPGEEKVSLAKREQLDMRKRAVHKVLLDKGAAGQRARVVLVVDKTGSMKELYDRRIIHAVVDRMAAGSRLRCVLAPMTLMTRTIGMLTAVRA